MRSRPCAAKTHCSSSGERRQNATGHRPVSPRPAGPSRPRACRTCASAPGTARVAGAPAPGRPSRRSCP